MPSTTLIVAVGSRNPVKVNSARAAFERCFPDCTIDAVGIDVPSGVPDQPWGDGETRQGAMARAQAVSAAYAAAEGKPCDFAVGLEGGVVEDDLGAAHPSIGASLPTKLVSCFAWMAVLQTSAAATSMPRWGLARTASFPLPPRMVELMRGDPPMELGTADDTVFGDTNSKQKGGTIGKLTHGLIDRTAYYEHALICALCPFLHDTDRPDLFPPTSGASGGNEAA